MKVLFDTCVPRPLRRELPSHSVVRAQELGWGELRNGDLLNAAELESFDLFVTADKNLRYQQHLPGRRIGILVLPTNAWPKLLKMAAAIAEAVDAMHPGEFRELVW